MISRFASTILLVFSLTALIPTFAAPPTDRTILLTNINIIDATGSPVQAGMNVLIENGYITAIERESISISDVEKIDGTGRFLIPGLWDMHVHWYDDKYLSLFIANGVTGIRQMWGFPMHYYWKAMVNYDEDFVAPRVLVGSVIIDGPEVYWPGSLSAKTELEGRTEDRAHHTRDNPQQAHEGCLPQNHAHYIPLRGAQRFQDADLACALRDGRIHGEKDHQKADRHGDRNHNGNKGVQCRHVVRGHQRHVFLDRPDFVLGYTRSRKQDGPSVPRSRALRSILRTTAEALRTQLRPGLRPGLRVRGGRVLRVCVL